MTRANAHLRRRGVEASEVLTRLLRVVLRDCNFVKHTQEPALLPAATTGAFSPAAGKIAR